MAKSQEAQAYHIAVAQFAGQDRAKQVVDLAKNMQKQGDYKVKAWAVVEVDDKGKAHVKQSGHGGVGAGVGAGTGALLGLLGGPAGLLIWTLGGALVGGLAGKYMGHQFDEDQITALAASMIPNSSALVVVIEDTMLESFGKEMGAEGGQLLTVTMADQLTGELMHVTAIDLGEAGAADAVDAAGNNE